MSTATIDNRTVGAELEVVGGDGAGASVVDPPVTSTMLAKDLHAAIADALNFAAPVSARIPAIAVVHVEATAERLVAVATDRFVLGATRVDYTGVPFTLTIGSEEAKTLARMAKTPKRDERFRAVDVTVGERQVSFAFSTGEAMTVRDTDTDFPKWRHLLPSSDERMGAIIGMGYRPSNLAKFAKVANVGGERMAVFPTVTERGPGCTVVTIGENFVGLVMPVRASGDVERYSMPQWASGTDR